MDDFEWALANRVRSVADVAAVFRRDNGFYRPVVGLTFSLNEFLGGTNPKPYGITNALLALACGGAIAAFCRGLGISPGASLFAAGRRSGRPGRRTALVFRFRADRGSDGSLVSR